MAIKDNYKQIGDPSKTGYENTSNNELIRKLNIHSGTTAQDIIKAELTRRLIDKIDHFNKESSKYPKRIMWLALINMTKQK